MKISCANMSMVLNRKNRKFLCALIREIETYFYNIITLAKKKVTNMKIRKFLLVLAIPLALAGCTSYKSVPYMQNPEVVNSGSNSLPLYDAEIMPKDLLSITVNTTDPQAAAPFNLTVQTPLNAALTNINTTTQPTLQQYLVNNKGEIDFPCHWASSSWWFD